MQPIRAKGKRQRGWVQAGGASILQGNAHQIEGSVYTLCVCDNGANKLQAAAAAASATRKNQRKICQRFSFYDAIKWHRVKRDGF